MDNDLKEALDQIKQLRALLYIAYDGGGEIGKATHPVEVTAELDSAAALLRKHGESDDMMDAMDTEGDVL